MTYGWLPDDTDAGNAEYAVIAASRRLARDLQLSYSRRELDAGKRAWRTPPIYFYKDWLSQQLDSMPAGARAEVRLESASSYIVWERILSAEMPNGILNTGGMARNAYSVWSRLHEWQVPLNEVRVAARTKDERVFAAAVAAYSKLLQRRQWLDPAQVASRVTTGVCNETLQLPARIFMAGFDRPTPEVNVLMQALVTRGSVVERVAAPAMCESVTVSEYSTLEEECRAAGAWAREKMEADAEQRVAIVVPSLNEHADRVARLVREGFAPGWQSADPSYIAAVNVSYGQRLADYPAVSVALLLLRWVGSGLRAHQLSVVLRSKVLGLAGLGDRSRLELILREHPDRQWTVAGFADMLSRYKLNGSVQTFRERLQEVAERSEHLNMPLPPVDIAERIDSLLSMFGWPGDSALDSEEFQLINRWRELLNEFSATARVSPTLKFADSVARLHSMAAEALYQPESGAALLQVSGPLEVAGLHFDAIRICELDSATWPMRSQPAAFLSRALQRRYGMPDATPADTLDYSKGLLTRLIGAATNCALSFATQRDDGEVTRSALVDNVLQDLAIGVEQDAEPAVDPGWYAQEWQHCCDLEVIDADGPPPVDNDEVVSGGAYMVQHQYVEPLSAFVFDRLGIRLPEPIHSGLSAKRRGTIVHRALHHLYADCPSQSDISAWSEAEKERRIKESVDKAISAASFQADPVLTSILSVEHDRLSQLLQNFHATELQRESFTVDAVERELVYEHAGVKINLRLDRLDRGDAGGLSVIDYKTGSAQHFIDRHAELKEMQLVVYANAILAADSAAEISTLILYFLDSKLIQQKGAGPGMHKKFQQDWPELLTGWRGQVDAAIEQFANGDVRIDMSMSTADSRPLMLLSRKEAIRRGN